MTPEEAKQYHQAVLDQITGQGSDASRAETEDQAEDKMIAQMPSDGDISQLE
jgi:hypothetical protein